jgi:hypothetical protein
MLIKNIFLWTFTTTQILDTVSTIIALQKPYTYEVNPILNTLMAIGNRTFILIMYQAIMTLLMWLLILHWEKTFGSTWISNYSLNVVCVFGILYLGLYRLIFIIIPNLRV